MVDSFLILALIAAGSKIEPFRPEIFLAPSLGGAGNNSEYVRIRVGKEAMVRILVEGDGVYQTYDFFDMISELEDLERLLLPENFSTTNDTIPSRLHGIDTMKKVRPLSLHTMHASCSL